MGCAASVGQFEYDLPLTFQERTSDKPLSPTSPSSPSSNGKRLSLNAITDDEYSSSLSTARMRPFPVDPYQPPSEDPSDAYELSLSEEARHALELALAPVPLPSNEGKRLKVLKQSNLLDSNTMDPEFDRFTSLAHRIFDVSNTHILNTMSSLILSHRYTTMYMLGSYYYNKFSRS